MHLMRAYRHCERTIVDNRVRRNVFYEEDLVIFLMTLVTNKTEVTNGTTTTTTTTSKYDRDDEATVVRSRDVFPEACCGSYVNLATECLLDKFDYRVSGSTDIALRVCNLEVLGDVDVVSLVPEFFAYEFVATAGDETKIFMSSFVAASVLERTRQKSLDLGPRREFFY